MIYEMNKTYNYKFEDVKFDNLDEDRIYACTISRFIGAQNYDKLMDSDTEQNIEQLEVKSFTKSGCDILF